LVSWLWMGFLLPLVPGGDVHPGPAAEEEVARAVKVIEGISSVQEKIKAMERLGRIRTAGSADVLEGVLLFKWEREERSRGDRSYRGRVKRMKMISSRDSAAKVRAKAAEMLGRLGYERSVPVLARVAREDPDPVVRKYAVKALLGFRDPTLVKTFCEVVLHDDEPATRVSAVIGLMPYADKVPRDVVKKMLNDSNPIVRLAGIKFVGFSRRRDVAVFLLHAAYDPDSRVKRRAAEILGEFDTAAAAEALLTLAKDADPGVSASAVGSLARSTRMKGSAYLDMVAFLRPEAGRIALAGSFNFWRDLAPDRYRAVRDEVEKKLRVLVDRTRRKVAVRRALEAMAAREEKLKKMFLTGGEKECKL